MPGEQAVDLEPDEGSVEYGALDGATVEEVTAMGHELASKCLTGGSKKNPVVVALAPTSGPCH